MNTAWGWNTADFCTYPYGTSIYQHANETDCPKLRQMNWWFLSKTEQAKGLTPLDCKEFTALASGIVYAGQGRTQCIKHIFLRPASSAYPSQVHRLSVAPDHKQWHTLGRDRPTQRPLPDNTQHSQETDIHDSGGIRTHNPNKRMAADSRLRPRGQMDRLINLLKTKRNPFYVRNQSVPRSKHFPPRL